MHVHAHACRSEAGGGLVCSSRKLEPGAQQAVEVSERVFEYHSKLNFLISCIAFTDNSNVHSPCNY